jgi:hypothetical protein
MGNFTVHHQRLKVLVELETDGEADVLPWDTQKASINRHTEVMQATYQWLRRIAQPYFDMTDNVVPRAFVEFYPQESEHVFNDGEIQIHDYSNRNRMPPHHKPDTDAPQISALQRTAGAHARAGFRCYDAIEDWQRPAYEAQLTAELGPDTDYTNLPVVEGDDPLEGFEETRAVELKNELLKLAKNHARRGIRYADELQPWQKVIYNNHLDTEISGDLETPTSVADVPTTLDELGGMQSSEESETETEDPDPPEPETESKQRAELALIVEDGDQELVGTLIADDREAIAERVGLTADADPDELHAELQRRLELLMELD